MRVINYGPENQTNLPVSGGGSAISSGALLKRGATPASDNGMLIPATGSSATPDIIGILRGPHATADDTLINGTVFTTKPVDILVPYRIVRAEYSVASGDLITCTQAVTTTTMTVTSLEDDIDSAFLYVVSGTGAGQLVYLTASASGSCTLKAAFGTSLDTTSKFIKILPRFHQLGSWTSDGTKLSSQAAAGATKIIVIDSFIVRNGHEQQLNPVVHSGLTGLNSLASLKFEANIAIRDTIPYSVD